MSDDLQQGPIYYQVGPPVSESAYHGISVFQLCAFTQHLILSPFTFLDFFITYIP